ncbi:MAG TPA: leucyl aminopeptidase [Gaiellaceae bacterium]|jgi:leucyl aminopeptidase
MRVDTVETPPAGVEADAIGVGFVEGGDVPAAARALGDRIAGELARLVEEREIRGRSGEVTILRGEDDVAAGRVVVAGLGTEADLDADSFRTAAAAVARRTGGVGERTLAWVLEPGLLESSAQARAIVDGAALGPYDHGRWRSEREEDRTVERLVLCGEGAADAAEEARIAGVVAQWTNRCRELVDAPPNELTPARLAEVAEEVAAGSPNLTFEALAGDEIEQAGMRLLAAVARGSRVPPRLIVMHYEPAEADAELVLGLVGKALTFDSGGLSLKPPAGMEDMKSDMAGGGAVIAAMGAIAELELPVRAIAVVASCENMPGGDAVRPGDVVTSLGGKTVEITNTDAEGRLALADALVHVRNLGATHLVDLATLTGGMVIAMGDVYAGVFGNDDAWRERIRAAGESSGDRLWPWPLHRSYKRYTDSPFADLKNSSLVRQGTPVYAAQFLAEFAGDGPWAHVDMAGTGYLERGRDDYYSTLGATGFGVRLLAELARGLAE